MSTISVRVTLLVLATVMFAAVWSNDHKPEPARLRTVVAYEFPTACPIDVIEPVSHEVVRHVPFQELISDAEFLVEPVDSSGAADNPVPLHAAKPETIDVSQFSIPLPRNLAAGEYRIIDRFGHVEPLIVTSDELMSWGIVSDKDAPNAYEVSAGENRWHFIRVEQPVHSAPTQAEISAAWKSVFRFTDRKVSPVIEKASAPMARWLSDRLSLSGQTRDLH